MAEPGCKVKVHYTGKLEDGTEFDSSVRRGEPIEFIVGANQVISGFDKAVCEMQIGEKREVNIPSAEAYGSYDEALLEEVPLENIPNGDQLPLGQYIVFQNPDGNTRVKVANIDNGMVTFDYNHELAGKDLIFEIELLSIVED